MKHSGIPCIVRAAGPPLLVSTCFNKVFGSMLALVTSIAFWGRYEGIFTAIASNSDINFLQHSRGQYLYVLSVFSLFCYLFLWRMDRNLRLVWTARGACCDLPAKALTVEMKQVEVIKKCIGN